MPLIKVRPLPPKTRAPVISLWESLLPTETIRSPWMRTSPLYGGFPVESKIFTSIKTILLSGSVYHITSRESMSSEQTNTVAHTGNLIMLDLDSRVWPSQIDTSESRPTAVVQTRVISFCVHFVNEIKHLLHQGHSESSVQQELLREHL